MSLHAVRRRGCRGARSTPARWCGLRTIASGSLSESCVRSSASARTSGRSQAVHVSSYSCSTCTCAQLACMHWCRQAGVTPYQDGCVQRSTVLSQTACGNMTTLLLPVFFQHSRAPRDSSCVYSFFRAVGASTRAALGCTIASEGRAAAGVTALSVLTVSACSSAARLRLAPAVTAN